MPPEDGKVHNLERRKERDPPSPGAALKEQLLRQLRRTEGLVAIPPIPRLGQLPLLHPQTQERVSASYLWRTKASPAGVRLSSLAAWPVGSAVAQSLLVFKFSLWNPQ
ncbi:UNVERIFIED_CONTAM: hypothetical protein FKN15_060388 [Acipenser sinensis]